MVYQSVSKKIKNQKNKSLYFSIYGVTSISEIEDEFSQQLFPIRYSKAVAIFGSILQKVVKNSLNDSSLMLQISDIDIQNSFDNISEKLIPRRVGKINC